MVGIVSKVLQDEIDHIGDATWHRLTEPHPAVNYDAAIPEIQDLQVLEVIQVGLEIRDQLQIQRCIS